MNNDGNETTRRVREIIADVHAQIALARELRKSAQNLVQQSADLHEFHRERLLTALSRRESRDDK